MSFLRSLIESGNVPLLLDYRTGSLRSLSGSSNAAPTVTSTPTLARVGRALAASFRGGRLTYAHAADQILTQATWMVFAPALPVPAAAEVVLSKRNAGGASWELAMNVSGGITQLSITDGTSTATKTLSANGPYRSFAWTLVNGAAPQAYVDAVPLGAGSAALTMPGGTQDVVVGAIYTGASQLLRPLYTALVVNQALTSAQIAQLYREIGHGAGHRGRRHFSFPSPVLSPTEYAAEGITLDVSGAIRNDAAPEHVSGLDPVMVGHVSQGRGGPFADTFLMQAVSSYGNFPAEANSVAFQGSHSVEAWVRPMSSAGTGSLLSSTGDRYVSRSGLKLRHSFVNGAAAAQTSTTTDDVLVIGQWQHLVWTCAVDGADVAVKMYVDSLPVGDFAYAAGMTIAALADLLLNAQTAGAGGFLGEYSRVTHYNRALAPAEVLLNYATDGRKCLLDAGLRSDGGTPVSIATFGPSMELLGTPWRAYSGAAWSIVEDAPAGGRPGKRWIAAQTGIIYTPDTSAYGRWEFEVYDYGGGGTVTTIAFVASDYSTLGNGYGIVYDAGAATVDLVRITAGVPTTLASGVVTGGAIPWTFEITRRAPDGNMEVWASTPTGDRSIVCFAADTTYTTCSWIAIDTEAGCRLASAYHYLGSTSPVTSGDEMITVATIPDLALLNDSALADRAERYVMTVRDRWVLDKSSTETVDNITVEDTLSGTGRWLRLLQPDPVWQWQAAWFINATTGDDENDGSTSGTALRTSLELARRIQRGTLTQSTTITIEEDVDAADYLDLEITVAPGYVLAFAGVPVLDLTANLDGWNARAKPTNNPGQASLLGWTPATHVGKLITFTTGPAAGYWAWIARDAGGGYANLSTPIDATAFAIAYPAVGNTAQVYSIPHLRVHRLKVNDVFPFAATPPLTMTALYIESSQFDCWIEANWAAFYNCHFDGGLSTDGGYQFAFYNCSGGMETNRNYAFFVGGVFASLYVSPGGFASFNLQLMMDASFPAPNAIAPWMYLQGDAYTQEALWFFGTFSPIIVFDGVTASFRDLIGSITGTGVTLFSNATLGLDLDTPSYLATTVADVEFQFSGLTVTFEQCPYTHYHTNSRVVSHDVYSEQVQAGGTTTYLRVGVVGSLTPGATRYVLENLTESTDKLTWVATQNTLIDNMRSNMRVGPGAGETTDIKVYKDDVLQTMTCQVAGAGANVTAKDVDSSHRIFCVPGTRIDVEIVNSNNGGFVGAGLSVSFGAS